VKLKHIIKKYLIFSISLVIGFSLVGTLFKNTNSSSILLRFIISIFALYLSYVAYKKELNYFGFICCGIIILYNPIFTLNLNTLTWQIINVIIAIVLPLISLLVSVKPKIPITGGESINTSGESKLHSSDNKRLKVNVLFEKGAKYYNQNNLEEAESAYLAGLSICPERDGLHNSLGCVYFKKREYEKAAGEFLKAIEINYNNALAHGNLGRIYKIWRRHTEAEKEWLSAVAITPEFCGVHYYLADYYDKENREEDALKHYKAYVRSYDESNDKRLKETQEKIAWLSLSEEERCDMTIEKGMQKIRQNPIGELYDYMHNIALLDMFKSAYKCKRLREILDELKHIIFEWDDPSGERFREKYDSGEYRKGNPCCDMAYRIGMHLARCASWSCGSGNPYCLNLQEFKERAWYIFKDPKWKIPSNLSLRILTRRLEIYSETKDEQKLAKVLASKLGLSIIDNKSYEFLLSAIEFWKISVEKSESYAHGLAELARAFIELKLFNEGVKFFERFSGTNPQYGIKEISEAKSKNEKITEWVKSLKEHRSH